MRKYTAITIAMMVVALALSSWSQTGSLIGVNPVTDTSGNAIPGIPVRVCTEAATGNPCLPLATVYTNRNVNVACTGGATGCSNPTFTDSTGGYYNYGCTPGIYTFQYSMLGRTITQKVACPSVSAGGSGTVTTIGDLPPLFTVTNRTTTPAFNLSAFGAHTFFGNNTGSPASPGAQVIGLGDIPTGPLGQVLIGQGIGTPSAYADPLVQGTQAAGSGTQPNPVLIGAWDGSVLRAAASDSSGRLNVNINGGVAVTGTFFQATQPVSIAVMPSTPVTGTFWQATQPVSGTFWQATQPVSGTVTTTPPSNASTNVAQVAGTTTDTNSGNKSAGTLRVVLATDQPALTNKLLVTPDSVALPANQSVNQTQWNGTTVDTNSGSKSAGTVRVVLATDQPQLTAKLLVTPDSVALPANQSVNVAQINGVTPLMGNGTTGTGSQRVTIASDNTAFSINATLAAETTKVIGTVRNLGNAGAAFDAATGAAPPANAILQGGLTSGATGGLMVGMPVGDTPKAINISTATTTLIVTGVSGRQVRITSLFLFTAAANNVAWIEGTGATCGTGTAGMSGGTTAASGWNLTANQGAARGAGVGTILQTTTAGDSVCLVTSATTQLSGDLMYAIY